MDLQVAGQGGREKGRRIRAKGCRLLGMRLTRIGATDSFPLRPASRNRGSIRSFAIESPSITRNLLRVQRYNSPLPFRGSHLGRGLWTGLPLAVLQRETRHNKPRKPPYIHPPFILFKHGVHDTGMHNPSSVRHDFCLDRLAVLDGKKTRRRSLLSCCAWFASLSLRVVLLFNHCLMRKEFISQQ